MKVAKWGNSLAVRIPADVAKALKLEEGDDIELHSLDAGQVAILTSQQRRAAAVDRMRAMAVPLPADYRFDREEANAR